MTIVQMPTNPSVFILYAAIEVSSSPGISLALKKKKITHVWTQFDLVLLGSGDLTFLLSLLSQFELLLALLGKHFNFFFCRHATTDL